MTEVIPQIGICLTEKCDLAEPRYQLSTRALLAAGADVMYIGGQQRTLPDSMGRVAEAFRVVPGETLRVVRDLGGATLQAAAVFTRKWDNGDLPALNDWRVRQASRKDRLYTQTLPSVSASTLVIGAEQSPDPQLISDTLVGDTLILKPVNGLGGRNVHKFSKTQLSSKLDQLAADPRRKTQVIQEAFAYAPWPGIRGRTPEENDRRAGTLYCSGYCFCDSPKRRRTPAAVVPYGSKRDQSGLSVNPAISRSRTLQRTCCAADSYSPE